MTIPGYTLQRLDGQTGVVRPSADGILAIIAAGTTGTINMASTYSDNSQALTAFTSGPIVRYGCYSMGVSQKPVILIACNATTVGTYGTVLQLANGGTSIATAGVTSPVDEFNVLVTWVVGGTRGTPGAVYTVSLDGGEVTSGNTALGSATSIVVNYPGTSGNATGVTIALGAGTFVAGGQIQVFTTRPQPNASDITNALEALRITNQPWEAVHIDIDAVSSDVGLLDTWLASLETGGVYNEGSLNIRHKLEPVSWVPNELPFASSVAAPAETEAVYAASSSVTSMATVASVRLIVGADACDAVDITTGLTLPIPSALVAMSVAMSVPIGQDPSWKGAGNIPSASIYDQNGNPKWHDENKYQTLDSLRFTTLRTWPGSQGTYITNANIFSSSGSDYVFLQQARVMNAVLTAAFQLYTDEIGKGIGKSAPDPTTGAIYILESSAQAIESFVNQGILDAVGTQVNAVNFSIIRTTDIGSNQGATLPAKIQVQALAYIKQEPVTTQFVRTITVPAS